MAEVPRNPALGSHKVFSAAVADLFLCVYFYKYYKIPKSFRGRPSIMQCSQLGLEWQFHEEG